MKIGKVNMLVTMRHFLRQWMCLRSEMVVISPRIQKTMYMDPKVMTSEPTHISSSPWVAMNPWLK